MTDETSTDFLTPSDETGQVSLLELRGLCHDLRQPLAAIWLLADAAKAGLPPGPAPDERLRVRLSAILDQVRWLADVVDDVLDPAPPGSEVPLDLLEVSAAAVQRARPTSRAQITLSGSPRVLVLADAVALRRALGNLLDNAVRAAGPGGRVRVRVSARGGSARVRVMDSGPGFGLLPRGHGLGLLVVRSFVEASRGRLAIGRATTGGATVTLSLPLLPSAGPQR